MGTLANMGRKKAEPAEKSDRHEDGSYPVRIRAAYRKQLSLLADYRGTSMPIEINRAVLELLLKENLWPPKDY